MRVWYVDGDYAAYVLLAVAAQVLAVERHAAPLRVEEAEEKLDDRRLAGPARAEQDDSPPRVEAQAEAVERRPLSRAVAGADVFELDRDWALRCGERLRGVDDPRHAIRQVEDPPARREGRLQLADRLAQRLNGLEGGQSEEAQESDQHAVEAPLRMRLNADREHDDDRRPGHEQAQGGAE